MCTDSKRRSALQVPQKAHPVCHNLRPIWESAGNNYYFQKISSPDRGKPLFSRGTPFFQCEEIKPKLLKKLEISIFRAANVL
jgi:hypothetical protein